MLFFSEGRGLNNLFVFDIETVPDVCSGRKILGLENLEDSQVSQAMQCARRQATGHDFMALHLQKVVAISILYKRDQQLSVWSLGDEDADEQEIIKRFFSGINQYHPTLVSWNGTGFDLPVLHYRALKHQVSSKIYWETGDNDSSFRWNNYTNRFHQRHLDVMEMLSGFQSRAYAPLDQVATMLGFPGKMGMVGGQVWPQYQAGQLKSIRDYCETDVLNTYLVFLQFQMIRGYLSSDDVDDEFQRVKHFLMREDKAHFQQFLDHWELPELNPSQSKVDN